jgi:uncharacterized membrane protein YcjF (UPF0283 family)
MGSRAWRNCRHLNRIAQGGNVLGMFKFGRLMQLVALVILPLAMLSQLSGSITLGQMLQFLLVGVGIFTLGYLLQRYSGGAG